MTAADIEELAKSLRPLSDEKLATLRKLLCPTAPSGDLGLEGVLKYWVENESSPTREKLLELTRELHIELPGMEALKLVAVNSSAYVPLWRAHSKVGCLYVFTWVLLSCLWS